MKSVKKMKPENDHTCELDMNSLAMVGSELAVALV